MGTEEAIVFTTTRPTSARWGRCCARRHGDRRLRRPRLDPRRLPALARQAAPVLPRAARQAREDAAARRGRRRRALVVVDGVFSMEGDVADLPRIVELPGARRAADGRRGARGGGARARRGRVRAARRGGDASTCGWGRSPSRSRAAAVHRRLARGDRVPAHQLARVPVHRRGPAAGGGAGGAADRAPRTRGRRCSRACSTTRATCATTVLCSASRCSTTPTASPRRSCRSVGDDWKAVILCAPCTTPACTSTSRCTWPSRRPERCCGRA